MTVPPNGRPWRRYLDALRRESQAVREERRVSRPLTESDTCDPRGAGPVVSLTSYPPRIGAVPPTLRSLLMQSVKPSRVELVLSEDEFPSRRLPPAVLELADRGVHVLWVRGNIRSFKKLVPVLDAVGDRPIVTADDDIVYPVGWLESLWTAHHAEPGAIWGTRGREILVRDGEVRPYDEWPFATRATPSVRTLLTGMGGILYPIGSLPEVTRDMDTAMRLCPNADDLWFKACAMSADTSVRQVANEVADLPTRLKGQRHSLTNRNLHAGENDRQFRAVLEHFGLLPRLTEGA